MLLRHYVSLVILFILQKPLFMLYAGAVNQRYGFKDWLLVMWHGLSIDMSVAGYLTVLPVLFIIIGI